MTSICPCFTIKMMTAEMQNTQFRWCWMVPFQKYLRLRIYMFLFVTISNNNNTIWVFATSLFYDNALVTITFYHLWWFKELTMTVLFFSSMNYFLVSITRLGPTASLAEQSMARSSVSPQISIIFFWKKKTINWQLTSLHS